MKRWFAATLAAAIFLLAACSEQPGFSVSGVSPVTGGAGTELSIAGTGFTGATSVTVCGVSLEAIDLTVEERKVAAPGTIGALTGSATLSGVVPDLGPSAECSVELTRPDGATVTWQGTFSFIGVPAVPENQPPTTSGLADILVTSDEDSRVIDLSTVFDDPDDGANALTLTFSLEAPAGNVSADLSDNELTLEFTSRVGTAAHVVVTATDPSGASVEAGFAVAFEVGIVRFEAPGLSQTELDDLTIMVTHVGDHVASAPAVELLLLRAGEYRFAGTLVEEAGTYIDRTKRDSVSARVDPSTETLVTLHLTEVPGSGRMWMPGRLVSLLSFTDDVLASGGTSPSTTSRAGDNVSSVAVAPDGAIWVSGEGLWRFDPSELSKPGPRATAHLTVEGTYWISNMAFDVHGNLWIAEYLVPRVQMLTADQVEAGGLQVPSLTLLDSAEVPLKGVGALAFDEAGNLWVGTADGVDRYIYRFDAADLTSGDLRPSLTIASEWASARHFDLVFDASGDMWYSTDRSYIGHVPADLLSATGTLTHDARQGIELPPSSVMSLDFDSRGNLWAVTRSGRLLTIMADDLDMATPPVAGRDLGMSFDLGGFVFID